MDDAWLLDLLQALRDGGGKMSRWELTGLGYKEAELQAAEQQGKVAFVGNGAFTFVEIVDK